MCTRQSYAKYLTLAFVRPENVLQHIWLVSAEDLEMTSELLFSHVPYCRAEYET